MTNGQPQHTFHELFGHFLASHNEHVEQANRFPDHQRSEAAIVGTFAVSETNLAIANAIHDVADAIRHQYDHVHSIDPDDAFHSGPPGSAPSEDTPDNVIPLRHPDAPDPRDLPDDDGELS